MKKILTSAMILVLMMTLATGTAFAAKTGTTAQGNEVPVYLVAPAIGDGDGGIDFTITDRITMTATAGSSVLSITNLEITNNAATGQLRLDSIKADTEAGWTIKTDNEKYFAELPAGTKEFSLVSEGNDFAVNGEKQYDDDKLIAPGKKTLEIGFTGHIGTFLTAVSDTQVAKITATVSPY